jgi:cyclophilin family peptidyl-prolyl cis-trans isomerase/HEAT repeat protein
MTRFVLGFRRNYRMSGYILLLSVLLLPSFSRAQYTPDDRDLAATTFTRNFDKVTEKEYLTSKDDRKVIAGLLSVSLSEDTNFVPMIIKLPVDKFAREICFALGQLGPSEASADYLTSLFYSDSTDPLTRYFSLIALGKTADSSFAYRLINEYNSAESKAEFNGISMALFYLSSDGKISADTIRPVLENELYSSSSRQFEAAFCLDRIGPNESEKELIVKTLERILDKKERSEVTLKPVPCLLGCLRKLHYFPDDFLLLKDLKLLNDFQSEVEAVKASVYYNFKTREELDFFLDYLQDNNKNISREAAAALKDIKLSGELQEYLYLKMSEMLHQDTEIEKYTQGELFISYLSLFPQDYNEVFVKFFNDNISAEYRYKVCGLYPSSEQALTILTENYSSASLTDKLTIIEAILNFDQNNPDASATLLSALNSDQPPIISITADGVDSGFVSVNKVNLSEIISKQTENHLNDPDFIEGLMSLENLAGRISDELKNKVIDMLSGSELYSVKKFAAGLKGESANSISKDIDDFDNYWNNAFKYRQAEIVTEEGSFTISFLPGYAPVTTGSFCYLAEKDFFNGVPFHRVVPGFVIQGGDPTGTGWGGPGYEIVSEFSPFEYNKGMVGMASAGKDTEGSQWFVTTGSYPHLNGRYTIFGEVLKGMDTVEKITQGTKIEHVNLIR